MDRTINQYIDRYLPALVLALLLLAPVLTVLFSWLLTLDGKAVFSLLNADTLYLIGKSLLISSTVALIATIIGTTCGFLLYKTFIQGRQAYLLLLIIPLLVSPYIFAVAWKDGLFLLLGRASAIYSLAGVMLVHVLIYFPLAMLITGSAFANINVTLEEAGLMVTSFGRMVSKIILPLIRPAIASSFLLILIFSLSDFSVPAFFGVQTFTSEIFTQFSAFYNHSTAIAQSMLLTGVCLLLVISEVRYLSRAPFFSIGSAGSSSQKYSLKQAYYITHGIFFILIFLSIFLPVAVLIYQSMGGNPGVFAQAWQLVKPTVGQSLKLAMIGAIFITMIGLYAGYLQERKDLSLTNYLLLATFILPSTIMGIALIKFYNQQATAFIYGSLLIILLGYLAKFGFIAFRIIGNGMKQIPSSLEEAGKVIGIKPWKRFAKIVLPLLSPSLFAAFVLSFVLCFGELGITIMVYPPGMELMPVKIFTISANAPQALTSSMTLISLVITLAFIGLFYLIGRLIQEKYRDE